MAAPAPTFLPPNAAQQAAKAHEMEAFAGFLQFQPMDYSEANNDPFLNGKATGYMQHSYLPSHFAHGGPPTIRISSASPAGISWDDAFTPSNREFVYLLPHVANNPGVVEPDAITDLVQMRGRPVRVVFKVGQTQNSSKFYYVSDQFHIDPAYAGGDGVRIMLASH